MAPTQGPLELRLQQIGSDAIQNRNCNSKTARADFLGGHDSGTHLKRSRSFDGADSINIPCPLATLRRSNRLRTADRLI